MNLLLSFFILMFAHSEGGSVHFMENPEVSDGGAIFLKDIAALEFLSAQDQEALGAIQIAENLEALKKMSSRDIMKKIKPKLRVYESQCECKLKITIPHAMVLRSLPGDFAIEKVETTILKELKKDCPICEFDISPLSTIRGSVPQSYTRWNVDIRRSEWRGPTMVRVYFDNDSFSPLILQTLIKIKKPILKLKHNINMGLPIAATDYETTMKDITYESTRFASEADLLGTEVKRTLALGTVLSLDDLVARNLVRVGQSVAIEMQNSNFMIEMTGVAQKTGRLGDKIPVRINKTQKNISAEIINSGRVRM